MRVKYLYERRFRWTVIKNKIVYLSLNIEWFNINNNISTRLDSEICVKNNEYNIPALFRTPCAHNLSYQVVIE